MLKLGVHLPALVAVTLSACTGASTFEGLKADPLRPVTMSGYLRFEFENRNLFPSSSWQRHWRADHCVPIGVRAKDSTLLEKAARLNGRKVKVTGTIQTLIGPSELNASFCKDVGLLAVSIEPI